MENPDYLLDASLHSLSFQPDTPSSHPHLPSNSHPPALSIPALDAYSFKRQKPPSPSAPKTTYIPTANARPLIPPSGNNPSVSPRIYSHPHYPSTASPSPHAITCNIPCSRPGKFAGLNGGLRLPAPGIQTRYGIENKQGPRESRAHAADSQKLYRHLLS